MLHPVLLARLTCGFGRTIGSCHLCRTKEVNIGSFLWLSLIVWCVCLHTCEHSVMSDSVTPLFEPECVCVCVHAQSVLPDSL